MYRIGIIGTENSHAMAFAKIMNQNPAKGARVVGVMGPDGSAEKIMDEVGVDFVAKDAAEFFGKVDAMMVTCRHGSKHADYARPFIEAGLPMFIDKPLTVDVKEAAALLTLAKQKKVLVSGGSGCKYAADVQKLKTAAAELRGENALMSAAMAYTANLYNEYDGLHFYAPHLVEVALTVLGGNIETVRASASGGSVAVTAQYPDLLASLHFINETRTLACTLFGKEKTVSSDIDLSVIYEAEVDRFLHMLNTGEMPQTYAELLKPVQVVCAIVEAVATGQAVSCADIAL